VAVSTALAATLALAGCGGDNPTVPDVPRSVITLAVTPNPITGSQNAITGFVTVAYVVTITELAGLGGEVQFVSGSVFDPVTGAQVGLNYFDSDDLVVFVGENRVEAGGSLNVPQTIGFVLPEFRREATLTVSVQFRDDRENLLNVSLLVHIV
jgi:hypothetical protein